MTHYEERCQFGALHGQCRCPDKNKAVRTIECPTPELHREAAISDRWFYGNCYICNDEQGFGGHNGRSCPTNILRSEADAVRLQRGIPRPQMCCLPWEPCGPECEAAYAEQGYKA